ncbi:MAG: hypothetical protein JWM88_545, partial [Verrucomicrobia bacterium]|nr:hypothetical protein [Verrucomicrobiota bacterium]
MHAFQKPNLERIHHVQPEIKMARAPDDR